MARPRPARPRLAPPLRQGQQQKKLPMVLSPQLRARQTKIQTPTRLLQAETLETLERQEEKREEKQHRQHRSPERFRPGRR